MARAYNATADWYHFMQEKGITLSQDDIFDYLKAIGICLTRGLQRGKAWYYLTYFLQLGQKNKLSPLNQALVLRLYKEALALKEQQVQEQEQRKRNKH